MAAVGRAAESLLFQVDHSVVVFSLLLCRCRCLVAVVDSSNCNILICRWIRGEQGEPGGASHAELDPDLGEEEQEEEQPVHPLGQGQGEVRREETWRGNVFCLQ